VLIKLHATYGGVEVKFHAFLTSAIVSGKVFSCKFRPLFHGGMNFPIPTGKRAGGGAKERVFTFAQEDFFCAVTRIEPKYSRSP